MPKAEVKEELYEVLLRFADGKLKGAQAQYLKTVLLDGVVLSQEVGLAMPVKEVVGAGGLLLADVLGYAHQAAIAEAESAAKAVAAARQETEAAVAALAGLKAEHATELEAAKAEYDRKLAVFADFQPTTPEPAPVLVE